MVHDIDDRARIFIYLLPMEPFFLGLGDHGSLADRSLSSFHCNLILTLTTPPSPLRPPLVSASFKTKALPLVYCSVIMFLDLFLL